nr:hypothetical protein [Tanacetum cinerariifolium]
NPAIYTSCIQQFWDSAKVKTVNEGVQMRALVDGKQILITEASIRCDLRLDDAEGSINPEGRRGRKLRFLTLNHNLRSIYIHLPMIHYLVEDASKQGRIAEIDADEDLSLIDETTHDHRRMNDKDLFRVNNLDGDEVIVDVTAGENVEQDATVAEKRLVMLLMK